MAGKPAEYKAMRKPRRQMWRQLFDVRLDGAGSLQSQIRVGIVDAILSGELAEIERLLHAHIVAPAEELMALQGPGHDHANEA